MIKIVLMALCIAWSVLSLRAQSWSALNIQTKPAFTFTVNDTLSFPVYVVSTPQDSALYFATNLTTNVCNDQICLPIEINLFWDLLGNYHHFSKEQHVAFTKFDHQYFDEGDYQKLNALLLDTLSPLRDYQVEDLLDKDAQKYSAEVDAVTRPTSLLFSNVSVPGALYTGYTLWHIVNGPIKDALHKYLQEQYRARKWQLYFADSTVPAYQEYFLKNLSPSESKAYNTQVVALLFAEDDFIPHYAIDILQQGDLLSNPANYNTILMQIDRLKPHVTTEIISAISSPNEQTRELLTRFSKSQKANPRQKELIKKLLDYEK
ncbi:hypothetical protein [Sphingobacterium sp. JB170]|uniref:hypothetical protein n=1 Tax=Sphingobacterium sp. JB170 TaxID=1434842 RepID=UPI000B36322B|nr:hypothetical protein [Sphingobacterium sp. JB170]